MISLPYRRVPAPPPPAPVCGSHALYRVEGTGTYYYCGPHLHMGLTAHLGENTVIYDADPGHQRCEHLREVTR